MQKWHLYLLRVVGILIILFGGIKLSEFIPTERLSPFMADQIAVLQNFSKSIQQGAQDFVETFQQVAWQRQQDREQEIAAEKQHTEKVLYEALVHENNRLRRMLNFTRAYSGTIIPVEVMGRSGDNWFRFVTVDKGSDDGVRQSMIAIDTIGLVGYVQELADKSAKIVLLTDPLVNISCVNERTGEIYVLTGGTAGRLEILYATLHSDIKVGDKLLTSGHSRRFKKGVPAAEVVSVTLPKNSLTKKVIAKPLADITGLDILFLVR